MKLERKRKTRASFWHHK